LSLRVREQIIALIAEEEASIIDGAAHDQAN
jgi:hypothetical protein